MNSSPQSARLAIRTMLLAAVPVFMTACAFLAPASLPLGTSIEDVRRDGPTPTGTYALPGGGRRLEFAQGSFGRQTFMLDFNAAGTLVSTQQVLTPANFDQIVPGMSGDEVLMRLGRPANVFGVPWQRLHVWNYRFFGGDCQWFQVSVSDAGPVTEAAMGYDPACDGPNSRN